MKRTISYSQYSKANLRLEELIDLVDDNTPTNDPLAKEFMQVSDTIEKFEEKHFDMGTPTLNEMIELRMFEMGLKKEDLATLLNTSLSEVMDYLKGERKIKLKTVRALYQTLNIDKDSVLH